MNASTLTRTSKTGAPCGCGSGPVAAQSCGSCGGAGCAACQTQGYVRPRFFAGQLLTEEDLQALSDYVAVKNRLHTRHFMGDGVVCGLQVTCHPCGGGKVIVQSGHALDCCGNDIVLECPVQLDVNALVRDLRRGLLGGYDCGDPCADPRKAPTKTVAAAGDGTKADDRPRKDEGPRHYCLYIRYCEEEIDPVAPYATDEPCGQAGCEPSRVREGARFELRCRTDSPPAPDFIQRAIACLGDLTATESMTSSVKAGFAALNAADKARALAKAKEALLDHLDRSPQLADCALRADVAAITIPDPEQANDLSAKSAAERVLRAYVRMLKDCVCRALLPPCPPCDDPAVLLACIEVRDCEVVDICDLERKFVLTAPNFRYWFPVYLFGDLLERMCCADTTFTRRESGTESRRASSTGAATAATTDAATGAAEPHAAPPPSTTKEDDLNTLKDLSVNRLLRTLGVSDRGGTQLVNIARDIGALAGRGAFDDLLPVRLLRRSIPSAAGFKESLSGGVTDSEAFKKAVQDATNERMDALMKEAAAKLEASQATALEDAHKRILADTGAAVTRETTRLEEAVKFLQSRLLKLERRT